MFLGKYTYCTSQVKIYYPMHPSPTAAMSHPGVVQFPYFFIWILFAERGGKNEGENLVGDGDAYSHSSQCL